MVRSQINSIFAGALVAAALVLVATTGVHAQQSPASTSETASTASGKRTPSKPLWRELTSRQQRALEPLAAHWDGLSEPHKRKWLSVSRNYANLSEAEQKTLHSRMTEWAALSQQERAQARLNFAAVKQVPVDERKAKWEAYQALSPDEKRKLGAQAPGRSPGATSTVSPIPAQKLLPIPAMSADAQHMPRIQLAPGFGAGRPTGGAPRPVSAEEQVPPPSTAP